MSTAHHDKVQNYHAIYREDTNHVLGVVNKQYPRLVQILMHLQHSTALSVQISQLKLLPVSVLVRKFSDASR